MAEPRFNSPYFWPHPPAMSNQIDNLVLINKIKEQLMAEKIRHQPLGQPLASFAQLSPPTPPLGQSGHHQGNQNQGQGQSHSSEKPNVALHARPPARLTSPGLSSPLPGGMESQSSISISRSLHTNSPIRLDSSNPLPMMPGLGISMNSLDSIPAMAGASKPAGMKHGDRGRRRSKALGIDGSGSIGTSTSQPVLVVPYPILASGSDGCKDGKSYNFSSFGSLDEGGGADTKCKLCPLTFFSKSEMQTHAKSHTEGKPHKCPHCSKSFANASYLAQHLRIHSGVRPYHCSYCEKAFRQLSHLQQHTRIHTGDRPYKCAHPGCEKAFTQLSNLQSHQRQHNKDKPYKCPNCYRAYTDSSSLQIHLATHAVKHAKAYCCNICGRAYTSETYLIKHMTKHAGLDPNTNNHTPPPNPTSPPCSIRLPIM
uniref:Zinc finger protein 362 n=1 Tax=Eptatretus burgeri TaxID=7764 RepID=A0A8C4NE31_EPTBU